MKKKITIIWAAIVFFLGGIYANAEEIILIKNGTIVPVVGKVITNGNLFIKDGIIAKIGTSVKAPKGAKIIDAKGMYVYPGMIGPLTAVGVTGYPGAGSDTNEMGVSTPHMDSYDAINPEDECIEVTRIDGVTTVLTVSGTRSAINGKAVALNLAGNLAEDMVIKRDVVQIFNTGARASKGFPSTLSGVNSLIRDKLNQAKIYAEKKKKKAVSPQAFKYNLEMEALTQVISQKVPALFITSDEVTIRNALHIIEEYNLKGIIFATAGILKFAEKLAAKNIPVIWAGTTTMPQRWEAVDKYYHTAAVLAKKGVLFAFNESGRPGSRNVRRQPVPASLSVAYGLSEEEAIEALTINPAKILGIDNQVGSLEKGKTANVIICTKSLVQLSSKIHMVIINGKIIPKTSVQIRLRDKFKIIVQERKK